MSSIAAEQQTIPSPRLASLAVPALGVVGLALAAMLASASDRLDTGSVVMGAVPALLPCVFPVIVFMLIGPQPIMRFGAIVFGLAGARFLVSIAGFLAVWQALDAQRGGFLLGFISVAALSLAAEKTIAVVALHKATRRGGGGPGGTPRDRACELSGREPTAGLRA